MMWFDYVQIIFAIVFSVPLMVVGFELFITLFHKSSSVKTAGAIQASYKILMPAHNEADIIEETLSRLIQQGVVAKNIVVVADNCADATAKIAEGLGVDVLERFNKQQIGKGFALDYGVNYLKTDKDTQPDVLIVLDADCEIDVNSLNLLTDNCCKNGSPVQALYLMRNKANDSLKRRVAGFAWLVKNKIRPIAVNKLGLPVTLTGTGMAFPWQVIADAKVAHGNIVEDMQLGIDCTLDGYAPKFCEQAVVYSDFPEQSEAENTQRTRWEHGHLMTIFQQVPALIKQAVIRRDWRLLGLALDIGVPPLALLVMLSLLGLSLLAIAGYLFGSYFSFFILLAGFVFFAVTLIAIWWRFGSDYLTFKELCNIPMYIISKLSIYFTFIFKRQKSWVRTARGSNG